MNDARPAAAPRQPEGRPAWDRPEPTRTRLERLAWCHLPLHLLADSQIATIHAYVERELATRNACTTPGVGFVHKERRLGATGREAWRWVAYAGDSVDDAAEVAVCTTRRAARQAARRHHAVYFADFARRALEDA